ncbi:MAG: geranylgeranyl reductase family protein [Chlorobiaceae bacterium]|nr:geranylgeranyl reductase family protein [Chlorobiaceae bacterium]
MQSYDVVISGAGLAGCSAALTLARNGLRVALLDKARFPREKVCGDGVTAASSTILNDLGVMELLRQRSGAMMPFRGVTLFSPFGTVMSGRFSATGLQTDESYVISRSVLDECLVSRAREHDHIDFHEQTAVDRLIMDGRKAVGLSASSGEFYGRFVIGADGAYSPVAKNLKIVNHDKNHHAFAIRAYFSNVEGLTDSIELHYEKSMLPGYGWVFPAGTMRANVGVGLMTRFTDQRGLKRMFGRFIADNPLVAGRMKKAVMEPETLKAWPLPLGSFDAQRGRDNVLLAGDAGSFIDPVTGEGIYYALKSGRYAAEAIARAIDEKRDEQVLRHFETLWRSEFLRRIYSPGYAIQPFLANRFFLEGLLRYVSGKQHRANLMADVIGHNRKRSELYQLFNPFFSGAFRKLLRL